MHSLKAISMGIRAQHHSSYPMIMRRLSRIVRMILHHRTMAPASFAAQLTLLRNRMVCGRIRLIV